MYIKKYWGNFIGGSDDSLNLVAFFEDQKKEEIPLSGGVNLQDLDEYNTPSRRIRITATAEEHDAMNKALADFAQNPLEYDLSEMMDEDGIQEMARDMLQVEYPNGFLLDMESRSAVAN